MIYKLVSPASVIFVDSDVRRGEEGARLSAWLEGTRGFLTENSNNILQSSVNLLLKQKEQRIINAVI